MTSYRVTVSVNIFPNDGDGVNYGNSLYHNQTFLIEGETFSQIAPTIDGIYKAINDNVRAAENKWMDKASG